MKGYWFECEKCKQENEFREVTSSEGIAHYIQDVLIPSDWDQKKLLVKCKKCKDGNMRITYEFPRTNREVLHVLHIVGVSTDEGRYVPMMWETISESDTAVRWFDFKYISGRKVNGLSSPAVFEQKYLKKVMELYCLKTGIKSFP